MVVEQFKSLLLPIGVDFVTGPKISADHYRTQLDSD